MEMEPDEIGYWLEAVGDYQQAEAAAIEKAKRGQ
jgi:hypothetical protein